MDYHVDTGGYLTHSLLNLDWRHAIISLLIISDQTL